MRKNLCLLAYFHNRFEKFGCLPENGYLQTNVYSFWGDHWVPRGVKWSRWQQIFTTIKQIQWMKEQTTTPPQIFIKRLDKSSLADDARNYYRIVWIEDNIESITVNADEVPFYPCSILFLLPSAKLKIKFGCHPPNGWILHCSRSFFLEQDFNGLNINHADVFFMHNEVPRIVLSPKIGQRINLLTEMIEEVLQSAIPNKELAAASLLKTLLVYCDSRCNIRPGKTSNSHYLNLVGQFKHYVSLNFHSIHSVATYAHMLNVTPKYLNQVVKRVTGNTCKSIIQEQIIIHACRDLKFSNHSIKETSLNMGFSESEHFTNFFKKSVGCSPSEYRQR